MDISGVLIGRTDTGRTPTLVIEASEPASGADSIEDIVQRWRRPELRISPAGYYRCREDSPLALSADETLFAARLFPDPDSVFLLIESPSDRAATGTFLRWLNGSVQCDPVPQSFPISRSAIVALALGGPPEAPELSSPADPLPAPLLDPAPPLTPEARPIAPDPHPSLSALETTPQYSAPAPVRDLVLADPDRRPWLADVWQRLGNRLMAAWSAVFSTVRKAGAITAQESRALADSSVSAAGSVTAKISAAGTKSKALVAKIQSMELAPAGAEQPNPPALETTGSSAVEDVWSKPSSGPTKSYLGGALAAVILLSMNFKTTREIGQSAVMPVVEVIQDRARLDRREHFHTGLSDWTFDASTFARPSVESFSIRPSTLAFYSPSLRLKDYQVSFRTIIEQGGLGFAYRAKDFKNYFAIKIQVPPSHTTGRGEVIRYAVRHGREDAATFRYPVPFRMHPGLQHHIILTVDEDRFQLLIDGVVVDTWRDFRLRSGGVGFFCEPGDDAVAFDLRLLSNDDFLGRFCALLSPGW
jgi:hypothetical protein